VVTIVDAGPALERCLNALAAQHDAPDLEVVIPWDDTAHAVTLLAARFPAFRFLPMDRSHRTAGRAAPPDNTSSSTGGGPPAWLQPQGRSWRSSRIEACRARTGLGR
jgi:hypothetical protein